MNVSGGRETGRKVLDDKRDRAVADHPRPFNAVHIPFPRQLIDGNRRQAAACERLHGAGSMLDEIAHAEALLRPLRAAFPRAA